MSDQQNEEYQSIEAALTATMPEHTRGDSVPDARLEADEIPARGGTE